MSRSNVRGTIINIVFERKSTINGKSNDIRGEFMEQSNLQKKFNEKRRGQRQVKIKKLPKIDKAQLIAVVLNVDHNSEHTWLEVKSKNCIYGSMNYTECRTLYRCISMDPSKKHVCLPQRGCMHLFIHLLSVILQQRRFTLLFLRACCISPMFCVSYP